MMIKTSELIGKVPDRLHVHTSNGGWAIWKEGAKRAIRRFPRRPQAIRFARGQLQARGGELIVHDKAGLVEFKRTFV